MPPKKKAKKKAAKERKAPEIVKDPVVLAREMEAFQMKSAGHTFDEIAEKLKFADRSGAHKACKRAMEYVEVHLGETLAEVLAQQLA